MTFRPNIAEAACKCFIICVIQAAAPVSVALIAGNACTPAVNDMPSKALQCRSGTAGVHQNVTPGN